jgi:two-component system phosphate regulon sensor histidine kinase PhoR
LGQPEPITLAVNFLPIRGPHDRIVAALAQFHDISEWKRMGQLRTDFIGAVSHELRTPLTSIKGLVRLALDEDLGPLSVWQRESLAVADAEIETA